MIKFLEHKVSKLKSSTVAFDVFKSWGKSYGNCLQEENQVGFQENNPLPSNFSKNNRRPIPPNSFEKCDSKKISKKFKNRKTQRPNGHKNKNNNLKQKTNDFKNRSSAK